MPAVVRQGHRHRWQGECAECGIGPYEPRSLYGAQRSPEQREQAREYLESLSRIHNQRYHAPREGQMEMQL